MLGIYDWGEPTLAAVCDDMNHWISSKETNNNKVTCKLYVKISSVDDHCKCSLCRAHGAEVLFCVRSLGSFTTRAMKVPRILYGLVINGMSSKA